MNHAAAARPHVRRSVSDDRRFFARDLLHRRILQTLFAAAIVIASNAGLPLIWPGETSTGYPVYRAISIAIALVVVLPRMGKTVTFLYREWTVIAFLGWSLLSVTWSLDVTESIGHFVQLVAVVLTCTAMVGEFGARGGMKIIAFAMTATSAVSLVVAWLAPQIGTMSVYHPTQGASVQGTGIFGWNSELGFSAAVGVVASVVLLALSHKALFLGMAAMNSAALLLSDSATSLFAALLGIAALAFLVLRKMQMRIILAAVIAGLLALAIGAQSLVDRILGLFGRSSDLTQRDVIWGATLGEIAERPLVGHGIGSTVDYLPLIGQYFGHAHSGYLQVTYDRGLIGIGFLTVMVLVALARSWRGMALAWLVAPMLLLVLVGNFANNYLASMGLGSVIFFWTVLAASERQTGASWNARN